MLALDPVQWVSTLLTGDPSCGGVYRLDGATNSFLPVTLHMGVSGGKTWPTFVIGGVRYCGNVLLTRGYANLPQAPPGHQTF